jgi:hypothetical protein
MTPVNPPEVVVWALGSFDRHTNATREHPNRRGGRSPIEPPQEIRSRKTRDQQDEMIRPVHDFVCSAMLLPAFRPVHCPW